VTNDPAARKLRLEVSATVEVVLAINPVTIVFPAFASSSGSLQPRYARLTGSQSSTVDIAAFECANKRIKVEFNRSGFDNDATRQVKISVEPGMPVGRFRERVTVKTDSEKAGVLTLFVMGEVLGAVSVSPRHLPLGTIRPGTTVTRHITLRSTHEDITFKVLQVSSTVEGLDTELTETVPGKEYLIAVSAAEGLDRPVIRGEILITTDVPNQQTITVRVFGRILRESQRGRPARSQDQIAPPAPL